MALTQKINSYFAILLVTVFGSMATMTIVNVALDNDFQTTSGTAANYAALRGQFN